MDVPRGARSDPAVDGDAELWGNAGFGRAGAEFGGGWKSNPEKKHERGNDVTSAERGRGREGGDGAGKATRPSRKDGNGLHVRRGVNRTW